MTIYSYEQMLAREEVRDNGGQEDKLVKWFVAQANAHCATLERKKRLVFKVLPEFRKADVLVRLATDAVDPTNEDEWVDLRVKRTVNKLEAKATAFLPSLTGEKRAEIEAVVARLKRQRQA
jgi:hypothetical protein